MNSIFKLLFAFVVAMGVNSGVVCAQQIEPDIKPNRTQRLMVERGYGMFVHFGMNTFLQAEWSDGTASADVYCPTHLNPEQWVEVAKDAGFRYVLLVTKHHDGFCLWDSELTDYDVMSSPVKIDVVKAVSDACRKYGLGFAVYYSLWDRHEPLYNTDFDKYIDFMEGQLEELMTRYGDVCELWFDGGWDKPADDWQLERIYNRVKQWQPDCAIGVNNGIVADDRADNGGFDNMVMPDDMIEGNTVYTRYFPMDFRLADPKIAHKRDCKQVMYKGKSYYMPFEHTICLSKRWNWFQKDSPMEVRSIDELEELFYWCTDNGNSLVVNVPPDKRGLIRENEADAVIALGRRLGLEQGRPLPKNGKCISIEASAEASSVWENDVAYSAAKAVDGGPTTRWASSELTPELILTLNPREAFNKISVFEYLEERRGEDYFSCVRVNRIKRYRIDILRNGEWECIYASDEPMGDCKVVKFQRNYTADKIRLKVLDASDFPSIYEFNVISCEK